MTKLLNGLGLQKTSKKLFFALRAILFMISLLGLSSCYRVPCSLEPQVNCTIQDRYLKQLPSPFSPLSSSELATDWGKEYMIGLSFARELDLYRAITAFRRAQILLHDPQDPRSLEMDYEILLCYYLGRRFDEVDHAFQTSGLSRATLSFPAFQDLLIILYETYEQLNNEIRQCHILHLIEENYPQTYEKLLLSSALKEANFPCLEQIRSSYPEIDAMLTCYNNCSKSVKKAQLLNAFIPGSGYLYVGQKQTAVTAFLFNGLFIAAAVHFFQKGNIPAGLITTSFESGWYFGGIYGVGQEAKFYNERLYERAVTPMMNRGGMFPVFMLKYSF